MKSTFSVIYYLKRQVVKKDGTVPVMGRITVDGSQTQFSCKLTVDPKLWDTKGGRVCNLQIFLCLFLEKLNMPQNTPVTKAS